MTEYRESHCVTEYRESHCVIEYREVIVRQSIGKVIV